jgi:DNA polymerase IV
MRLDNLPRIFLLSTHLKSEELHHLEERIPTLTYDINEAEIVIGKISQQRRAEFELRRAKLEFVSVEKPQKESHESDSPVVADDPGGSPDPKRRRIKEQSEIRTDIVKVVKLAWLLDSWKEEELLPMDHYLIFQCNRVSPRETTPAPVFASVLPKGSTSPASSILERALLEQKAQSTSTSPSNRHKRRHDASTTLSKNAPSLLHQTTSEHDITLPVMPEFLRTTYSCQRPTYMNPPNEAFVNILTEIRTIRQLREDEVGVRAYSTSIASVAAYPYALKNPQGEHCCLLWYR